MVLKSSWALAAVTPLVPLVLVVCTVSASARAAERPPEAAFALYERALALQPASRWIRDQLVPALDG